MGKGTRQVIHGGERNGTPHSATTSPIADANRFECTPSKKTETVRADSWTTFPNSGPTR